MKRPKFADDLFPPERLFLADWNHNVFVRYEGVRFQNGQLLLDPWPKALKNVHFGSKYRAVVRQQGNFELKEEVADFFDFVRTAGTGEIRCLVVRYSIPFSMEIDHRPGAKGAGNA